MTGPFATRLFRIAFTLAGCYNLAFGFWASAFPLAFFEIFRIDPPRYPGIWACVGMIVGVYGLLYLHVAWKPEHGRPIIAVGLLGKVLGPIGMALNFSDAWPLRLGLLCVFNDLIWWLPFGLFLVRGTAFARLVVLFAPWICAVLHLAGLVVMGLFLRHGTLAQPSVTQRAAYISEHPGVWIAGWVVWMLSALSLVGFYAWWGSRLKNTRAATVGVILAGVGSVFDLSGEALTVLVLAEEARVIRGAQAASTLATSRFEQAERIATLMTAGAANALYTLGGLILMRQSPGLPRLIRLCLWGVWFAGFGMTAAAYFDHVDGMVITTSILFPLFILSILWMGVRWRPSWDG